MPCRRRQPWFLLPGSADESTGRRCPEGKRPVPSQHYVADVEGRPGWQNKKEFNSATLKTVITMGEPTRFEPLLAGTQQLAVALIPNTRVTDILKLTEHSGAFDVAGVLTKGPENQRTPTTKAGRTVAADYELLSLIHISEPTRPY